MKIKADQTRVGRVGPMGFFEKTHLKNPQFYPLLGFFNLVRFSFLTDKKNQFLCSLSLFFNFTNQKLHTKNDL